MKLITMIFFLSGFVFGQNAWINEFHYDNGIPSTDDGEFIEVAIEDVSSYDLSKFQITLYNGSASHLKLYELHSLTTFSKGITENNITLYYKLIPGIQNGSPDGFSLDYDGILIQFLSYEGSFTPVDGPAAGVASIDVGVAEGGATLIGESLQLIGSGTKYSEFMWSGPVAATMGSQNNSQLLPVELTSFSALIAGSNVELLWETATEVNNYGFNIERKSEKGNWLKVSFVEGHGNSNSIKSYQYEDNTLSKAGKYNYRLKQIDIDGSYEYSQIVEVEVGIPEKFEVSQNFPNPFNPTTTISFSLPEEQKVNVKIFNMLGEVVETLVDELLIPGKYKYDFDASKISSGTYFYRVISGDNVEVRKMLLLK